MGRVCEEAFRIIGEGANDIWLGRMHDTQIYEIKERDLFSDFASLSLSLLILAFER